MSRLIKPHVLAALPVASKLQWANLNAIPAVQAPSLWRPDKLLAFFATAGCTLPRLARRNVAFARQANPPSKVPRRVTLARLADLHRPLETQLVSSVIAVPELL